MSKDSVFVFFVNGSAGRDIDSTWVERQACDTCQWQRRGAVGEDGQIFVDTLVSPGTYLYRLKHVTLATPTSSFQPAPPRPNSGWDISGEVTVPGFPPPYDLWCDDTLIPSVKCFWTNATDTASIQVKRNGSPHDTQAAGSDSLTHTDVSWNDTVTYFVRHLATAHGTVSDWSDDGAVRVEKTAPAGMLCGSGTGEVEISCAWSLGEVYDTTGLWRSEDLGESWSLLLKLPPAQHQYFDQSVENGETYCYRARHRREWTLTGFSNVSCETVDTTEFPIPGVVEK